MYVDRVKKRVGDKVYCSVLIRESYRDERGEVQHRTLATLTKLPPPVIDLVERYLKGELQLVDNGVIVIQHSLPHGHVLAVLGTIRKVGLAKLIDPRPSRQRKLVQAMICGQILWGSSKLALARRLSEESACSTLGLELRLGKVSRDELYRAMDWLLRRQEKIQQRLAARHLKGQTLLLYDVTSAYYTGRESELVRYGYNRDGKRRHPQIVYGLLCDRSGCPIAVEVFAGNTADPKTLSSQIERIRERFGIERVVLVGDRGLITSRRIEEELRQVEGLDWLTALRADTIRKLARQGRIERSLFDEKDLAEIRSPDFPGERLIVCRNPFLADERARKREELLKRTERDLERIAAATRRSRRPLRDRMKIVERVGRVLGRSKVAKHFGWEITQEGLFRYWRNEASIEAEAALDGIYVIRTSVPEEQLDAPEAVAAYKQLSRVEWAFRAMKSVLDVRPIRHWRSPRIRAHVFLCMLAYYVRWHMEQAWAPLLFVDHERQQAESQRRSVVDRAPRSEAARKKEARGRTVDGQPVHSFRTLLDHLASLCRNRVQAGENPEHSFWLDTSPTPLQAKALQLLGIRTTTPKR